MLTVGTKAVRSAPREILVLDDQLTTETLGILLGAAAAAPGVRPRQPWRLEVNGHLIDAYLDGSAIRSAGSLGRANRIVTGAAIFNLRCAAASRSFGSWVSLYPYPHDPDLAARIVVEPTGLPDHELEQLYGAILSRCLPRPRSAPGATVRRALERTAAIENTTLGWLPVSFAPLALLSTDRDAPADQLAAGIALQRVLLTATRCDIDASYLPQPLSRDELRHCAQELTSKAGFAQALIRFGRDTRLGLIRTELR
jgi:hypothetical protein